MRGVPDPTVLLWNVTLTQTSGHMRSVRPQKKKQFVTRGNVQHHPVEDDGAGVHCGVQTHKCNTTTSNKYEMQKTAILRCPPRSLREASWLRSVHHFRSRRCTRITLEKQILWPTATLGWWGWFLYPVLQLRPPSRTALAINVVSTSHAWTLPPEVLRTTIAHLFVVRSTTLITNISEHTLHPIWPWTVYVLPETHRELKSPKQPRRDRQTQNHGVPNKHFTMCATGRIHIVHKTLTFHIVNLLVSGKRPRNSEDIPRSSKPLHPPRHSKTDRKTFPQQRALRLLAFTIRTDTSYRSHGIRYSGSSFTNMSAAGNDHEDNPSHGTQVPRLCSCLRAHSTRLHALMHTPQDFLFHSSVYFLTKEVVSSPHWRPHQHALPRQSDGHSARRFAHLRSKPRQYNTIEEPLTYSTEYVWLASRITSTPLRKLWAQLVLRGQHFEPLRVYLQRHGANFSHK